jgi:putative DNA primase/helicase
MNEGIERGQKTLDEMAAEALSKSVASESLSDAVARLAGMGTLEYEQVREVEAQRLGVRVGVLDKEVSIARRTQQEDGGKKAMFPTVEPWPEPVDGAELLNDLLDVIQRFIVCERETAITASLWCAFTWLVDSVQVAPLAVITAPEKRCGKSQLLNLIGMLSRRPLVASNISPAATFRVIEAHSPTLLIDEADSFFKENEELRGVINSGHTRQSAYVIRTVGDDHEPRQFSTWGAKAISGIGHLAETIMDRAVILELRRKLPSESVQRLRHAEPGLFNNLASRLARYADDAGSAIERARPELPEELNDRAQDNWEPLLAIADHAGGEWPQLARYTALKLSGAEQEAVSLTAELLADIREVFEHKKVDRLSTADLLQALNDDDIKPWATYNRGKPMTPRQLAKRLDEYGIQPRTIRAGYGTAKGFTLDKFEDAFSRYLTPTSTPEVCRHTSQPNNHGASSVTANLHNPSHVTNQVVTDNSIVTDKTKCDGTQKLSVTPEPAPVKACDGVTDKTPILEGVL